MREHFRHWGGLYLWTLGMMIFTSVSLYLIHRYDRNHTVCDTVTRVYVCTGGGRYTDGPQCRVDTKSGRRLTTNGLVTEGDRYCWVE